MKLKNIHIKNFRSIQDQTFEINRNFQILVGINESGKTNIIKAISLLNKNVEFTKDDIRDPGFEEEPVSESNIRYVFKLSKIDIDNYFISLKEKFLTKDINGKLLDIADKEYSLYDFCKYKDEVLYNVNLLKNERSVRHWRRSGPGYRIAPEWKIIKNGTSLNIEIKGVAENLKNYTVVNINEYPEIPEENLDILDITSLNALVGEHLIESSKGKFPNCIVWKYNEENLLPNRISLPSFIANPDSCVPLKNMFSLAGYENISTTLQEASGRSNGLRNILRKVSENTTKHIQKVWPEWKNQKVNLVQNGDFLEAGIEDEYNIYSLAKRSDGFKRFFTFLLMISVQNQTEEIRDNIIIIDEPDTGLHPSGVTYLKNELIKIGQQNMVVVSTHSIFMIDKEIVDRHLIVQKNKEITKFERVGVSNITDEEVIYKALGFSLYELLKPKNIIFEGWRDKKIFETLSKSKNGKKIFKKELTSNLGMLHAFGVKDIQRVANLCENISRDYIIITDSDKPAKEKQRAFEGSGKWLCYDDIDNILAITIEDFYHNTLINRAIRTILKENDIELKIFLGDDVKKNKIDHISKELKSSQSQEETKKILNQIKEYCSLNASASDFSEDLFNVAEELINKIYA